MAASGSSDHFAASVDGSSVANADIHRRHATSPRKEPPAVSISSLDVPTDPLSSAPDIIPTPTPPVGPFPSRLTRRDLPVRSVSRVKGPDLSLNALAVRHRYLLVTMIILVVLCTVYLYFAVSMGADDFHCQGLRSDALQKCRDELLRKRELAGGGSGKENLADVLDRAGQRQGGSAGNEEVEADTGKGDEERGQGVEEEVVGDGDTRGGRRTRAGG